MHGPGSANGVLESLDLRDEYWDFDDAAQFKEFNGPINTSATLSSFMATSASTTSSSYKNAAVSEFIADDASVTAVGEEFNGDELLIFSATFLSGNVPFIFPFLLTKMSFISPTIFLPGNIRSNDPETPSVSNSSLSKSETPPPLPH